MSIVAISFTSESSDRYLSLYTNVTSLKNLVSELKDEYGEEFEYLYIDSVKAVDRDEDRVRRVVQEALEESRGNYE